MATINRPFLFVGSVTPLDLPTEHYYVWFDHTAMWVLVRGTAVSALHVEGYTATSALGTAQRRCALAFHLAQQCGLCRWPVSCPCGGCFSMPRADMSPYARPCRRCNRVAYPMLSDTLLQECDNRSPTELSITVGGPTGPSTDEDIDSDSDDDSDPDYGASSSDTGPPAARVKREARPDSPSTDTSIFDSSEASDSDDLCPDCRPARTSQPGRTRPPSPHPRRLTSAPDRPSEQARCTTPPRPTQPVNLRPKKRMRFVCRK